MDVCANEQTFFNYERNQLLFNYLESDYIEALPDAPSPLGLLERFPVIKNIFTENSFFKNKIQSQKNEIPVPLLHDKYPFQGMRALPGPPLQCCDEK